MTSTMTPTTTLYLGIDVGKFAHAAAFLTPGGQLKKLPTVKFDNSRAGFELLLASIRDRAAPEQCAVLLERTGHYGLLVEQYLQEHGCHMYRIQVKKKIDGADKTDVKDAQRLATLLYHQLGLHAPVVDASQEVRPLPVATLLSSHLYGLVQHRQDLVRTSTACKNRLTAICDEMFPEITQVYVDPNSPSALLMRLTFPTPAAIAAASLMDLCAARKYHHPSMANLKKLQQLAATTIGQKNGGRISCMVIEQEQLIAQLQLVEKQIAVLEEEITRWVAGAREGKIIQSLGIGNIQAGILLASIGSISRFASPSKLQAFMGWAPHQQQTGTSYDKMSLRRGGNKLLKATMFMVSMNAIKHEPWKSIYERLVQRKCNYDARKGEYIGKLKCVGHIAGQLIETIYVLLRQDYEQVRSVAPGQKLPEPVLYDPSINYHNYYWRQARKARQLAGKATSR